MYDLDYVVLRYFNVYGPRLNISGQYNRGPKPEKQEVAKAENMKWPTLKILRDHIMRGGLRPPPCGDSLCGPSVFSALATSCFFGFGHFLFFRLWPPIIKKCEK